MYKLFTCGLYLLLLDGIFLYFIVGPLFQQQIKDVQHSSLKMNIVGAIASYSFLIGGLYYFIIQKHKSVVEAFLLGFFVYGVYETTTYALLKDWRFQTVCIDTLWGGILFALTTKLTYLTIK
jgi:uncharacterized membrane protein